MIFLVVYNLLGTMMIVNEMEKKKIVPTEVRYIAKKIKGKAMADLKFIVAGYTTPTQTL